MLSTSAAAFAICPELKAFTVDGKRVIVKNTFLDTEAEPSINGMLRQRSAPALLSAQEPPPPPCTPFANQRYNSQRNRGKNTAAGVALEKITLGIHIGVISTTCTREGCRVESKKTGVHYQKCHCLVKEVKGQHLLIEYVNKELSDEWIVVNDKRIVVDKDEKWCVHGRVCNQVVRGKTCKRCGENGSCHFCHEGACAAGKGRKHFC